LDGTAGDDFIRILTNNQAADDGMFAVNERGAVAFRNVGTFYIHDGEGNDLLLLDREEDYVFAGAGRDTVHAGGGDDYFFLSAGVDEAGDVYDGGAGDDLILNSAYETLDLRDDTLENIEGFFMSGGGKLQVTAAQLAPVTDVRGSMLAGHIDTLEVTMGASTNVDLRSITFSSYGDAGDKVVVKGDSSSEFIEGSNVDDVVKAGGGNDHVKTNNGTDTVDGGKGSDTVDYSNRFVSVEVALKGNTKVGVKIDGIVEGSIKNVENVWGGAAGDKLKGDSLANTLNGMGGEDRLKGFAGNDKIEGGLGADTVWGGSGSDKFVFATAFDAVDHIKDFSHVNDTIVLDNAIFTAFAKLGAIRANKFVANASGHDAHTAKQKLIYDKADHSLWYDADGNGAGAAIEIVVFDNKIKNLDFHDFMIV
jgi:Ca2+-binding RTX toxin-like protein